jgi:hypothetical protein
MVASIFDASVLVFLAQRDAFSVLAELDAPRLVPDIVDEELCAGAQNHPTHYERYSIAKTSGLLQVTPLAIGSDAYAKFIRLRASRTSPGRNRGEDACVALALTLPGSHLYIDDVRAANRARDELMDPERVRSSAQMLGPNPGPRAS